MFAELASDACDFEDQAGDFVTPTTLAAWAQSELLPKNGGEFDYASAETVMSPS
jgi:hypothetical protein